MVVTFLCSRLRVKLVKNEQKNPLRLLAVEQNDIKNQTLFTSQVTSNQKTKLLKWKIPSAFFSKQHKIVFFL